MDLHTFSIAAYHPGEDSFGIAVATARPTVGNLVPFVSVHGAIATQALKRVPEQRYPHAGAANARVEVWRFDLDGEGARVPLPEAEYLATCASLPAPLAECARYDRRIDDREGCEGHVRGVADDVRARYLTLVPPRR